MEQIIFWKSKDSRLVDPTLFSERAENLALKLEEAGRRKRKDGSFALNKDGQFIYDANKRTQVRKFYDEVHRLNDMAKKESQKWEIILPMLHMLVAKAAYAEGRNLTSPHFTSFLKASVGQISDMDDLNVFANFFEAFMGFYRLLGPKN